MVTWLKSLHAHTRTCTHMHMHTHKHKIGITIKIAVFPHLFLFSYSQNQRTIYNILHKKNNRKLTNKFCGHTLLLLRFIKIEGSYKQIWKNSKCIAVDWFIFTFLQILHQQTYQGWWTGRKPAQTNKQNIRLLISCSWCLQKNSYPYIYISIYL